MKYLSLSILLVCFVVGCKDIQTVDPWNIRNVKSDTISVFKEPKIYEYHWVISEENSRGSGAGFFRSTFEPSKESVRRFAFKIMLSSRAVFGEKKIPDYSKFSVSFEPSINGRDFNAIPSVSEEDAEHKWYVTIDSVAKYSWLFEKEKSAKRKIRYRSQLKIYVDSVYALQERIDGQVWANLPSIQKNCFSHGAHDIYPGL